MPFLKFDAPKTVQAIAVVLRKHRHETAGKLRVLKILYIADRESIKEVGFPMFGCRMVAMDHGPLHSDTEHLIDGEHIDEPLLWAHVRREGHQLELTSDPGVGKLSRYEIEKLQEVCDRCAAKGDWEIANGISHGFKEWMDRYRPGTSTVIQIEDVIDAVGRGADKQEIIESLRAQYNADAAFGARSL